MNKKYKLTHHTKVVEGHTLHRIKALKSFGDVKKGDLGGWVESYRNLSQSDYAWVYDKAKVWGNAKVFDNAKVSDHARVYGDAIVCGFAQVCGNVHVYDNAKVYGDSILQGRINIREDDDIKDKYSYLIFNNTWSSGRQFVYVLSNQRWHVGCFNGTGDELIKKAYRDSKLSGKMYGLYVNFAEQAVKTQQQLQSHKGWKHWYDPYPSLRDWLGL